MWRSFLVCGLFLIASSASAQSGDWTSIFNGKDLSGWEGDAKLWSVKDGAITGTTTKDTALKSNSFLIWTGKLANFELKCKFRMEGGNSGVQYRSKHLKDAGSFVVAGYQADMDSGGGYTGILYEERGRGILVQRGQKIQIQPNGDKFLVGSLGDAKKILDGFNIKDWNDYHLVGQGNVLKQSINGKQVIELIDHQEGKRVLEGILALQIHVGPPMVVQFKEIQVKHLPEGGVVSPEQTPLPKDAVPIGGKKK